jgi:phosphoribosyl-AMP cyclohydrolase
MIDSLKFDQDGLIPCIVQSSSDGQVLMMAWMNSQTLELSLETGFTHFFSRSRQSIWKKGESSGNLQRILEIRFDCDSDCLLAIVEESGPACHNGTRSCFEEKLK